MKKIEMKIKDFGVLVIALDEQAAPISTNNFLKLVNEGFYTGLIFHRVIKGFVIQGGGYDEKKKHHQAQPIVGEFASNGHNNPIVHKRGVISMARTSDKNSASSQFFIIHQDAFYLDKQYAGFGEVISGMEIVDKIANVATDNSDCPLKNVVIEGVKVLD